MITDNALKVLQSGANLRMKCGVTDNMVTLAAAAKRSGVMLTLVGQPITDNMVRIARAGGAHVTFDTAEQG